MTVAIVTDGAASLPDDRSRAGNVTVVPLRVMIGPAVTEDAPVTLAEILAADPGTVRTSCPAPARYLAAVDQCGSSDGVLICTVAATLSGSYQAALQASRRARVPVRVADTGTAAGGQGLVVLAAARAAQAGADLETVAASVARYGAHVRLVGTLDNIDHLKASGRVPRLASWAADRMGVHPVFELRAGRIRELRPARSQHAAETRMLERLTASGRIDGALHVAVLHVRASERAQRIFTMVTDAHAPALGYITEFDVAMAAHLGSGVVGLAWWREQPQPD